MKKRAALCITIYVLCGVASTFVNAVGAIGYHTCLQNIFCEGPNYVVGFIYWTLLQATPVAVTLLTSVYVWFGMKPVRKTVCKSLGIVVLSVVVFAEIGYVLASDTSCFRSCAPFPN